MPYIGYLLEEKKSSNKYPIYFSLGQALVGCFRCPPPRPSRSKEALSSTPRPSRSKEASSSPRRRGDLSVFGGARNRARNRS